MICGKKLEIITHTHLKSHNLTVQQYQEQFPNTLLSSDEYRYKKSVFITFNNPMKRPEVASKLKGDNSAMSNPEVVKKVIEGRRLYYINHPEERQIGEKHPMYGKKQTPESNQKNRESHLGKKDSEETKRLKGDKRRGKRHEKETKQKISNNNGMNRTEVRKKASENHLNYSLENNPNWKGGISYFPYCSLFNFEFKERVREYFNRCCYVCGMIEQENRRSLSVHHVNYNKMVCCNDVEPLFVPLCIPCHSNTQGDREYWEEFFTVSLNYLTNGKCFYTKEEMFDIKINDK